MEVTIYCFPLHWPWLIGLGWVADWFGLGIGPKLGGKEPLLPPNSTHLGVPVPAYWVFNFLLSTYYKFMHKVMFYWEED